MGLTDKVMGAAAVALVDGLVSDIIERYPPSLDKPDAPALSPSRLTRILEDACQRAARFQADKKLGLLRKALFANTVRWRLADAGYSRRFVELAVEGIVVYMARRASAVKP
jgi:hypothetical protein